MTEFRTALEQYQQDAVNKLSKIKVGALYMEQGTGKTRTAMELAFRRLDSGKVDHILWLCPCNVKNDIRAEFEKHLGRVPSSVTICGIETLSSSIKWNVVLLKLVKSKRVFLIVDESNLVKNMKAERTQNIARIGENCQYKLILNGTPIARNEADLFAQWYILDWRILGYKSFWSFSRNHIKWSDICGKIDSIINVDYLMRKIAPYTFQITKAQAFSIPGKAFKTRYFELTSEQIDHYNAVVDELLPKVNDDEPFTIYRLFSALESVTSGLRVTGDEHLCTEPMFINPLDNPRIKALLSVLPDEKAIIFCKREHEAKDIMSVLNGRSPGSAVEFTGRVPTKQRGRNKDLFRGPAKYMVANKACGAYGLNLQFCHNVVYYNNDWDYATRAQSEDRVHRRGQTHEANIIDIVANETLDERIVSCLSRKENLLDSFKRAIKSRQELEAWVHGKKIPKK